MTDTPIDQKALKYALGEFSDAGGPAAAPFEMAFETGLTAYLAALSRRVPASGELEPVAWDAAKLAFDGANASAREYFGLSAGIRAYLASLPMPPEEDVEAVEWIGVVRDELAKAGYPAGDRDVALATIRRLLAAAPPAPEGKAEPLKAGYALYLEYVDKRDRLMPDDPKRPAAQAAVEAAGEMYFLIRGIVAPGESNSAALSTPPGAP